MKRALFPVGAFGLLALAALSQWGRLPAQVPGWYGIAVFLLLAAKLVGSLRQRPVTVTEAEQARVDALNLAVVVTMYNEDPTAVRRGLESLLTQSRLPQSVTVVDDGSKDPAGARIAWELYPDFIARGVDYRVVEQENKGKRHALAAGFELHPEADVFLGVDSDTVLHPEALAEGMKPFAKRSVNGVTGQVLAWNHRTNLLTRLIDLRYANAFLYERAAYSTVGSVLCICGSLGFYRASVVREHLEDFLDQRFLGRAATYGDDRRLTNYCLLTGRVVLQSSAVAWTLVPERVGHYLKQQVRWNKSFFRESLWVVTTLSMRRPAFWLTLVELTSWITFTVGLLAALVLAPMRVGLATVPVYAMFAMLLSWARSVRYLEAAHERMPWWERLATYAVSPVYGFLHIGVLLWLRLYALATLRDNGWGTRQQGVEVAVARPVDEGYCTLDDLLTAARPNERSY